MTSFAHFLSFSISTQERPNEKPNERVHKRRIVYDMYVCIYVYICMFEYPSSLFVPFSFAFCFVSFHFVSLVEYMYACTINYVSDDLQIDYYPFKTTPYAWPEPLLYCYYMHIYIYDALYLVQFFFAIYMCVYGVEVGEECGCLMLLLNMDTVNRPKHFRIYIFQLHYYSSSYL